MPVRGFRKIKESRISVEIGEEKFFAKVEKNTFSYLRENVARELNIRVHSGLSTVFYRVAGRGLSLVFSVQRDLVEEIVLGEDFVRQSRQFLRAEINGLT